MQDKPTATELLEALASFLTEDVVPAMEGRRRFHAIVAANVARIVARELSLAPEQLEAECRELWKLLGRRGDPPADADRAELALELNAELCELIDRGGADSDPVRGRVMAHLERIVDDKLRIDDPKLLEDD